MIKLSTVITALVTLAVAASVTTASHAGGFTNKGSAVMLNPQPLPPGPPCNKCGQISLSNNNAFKVQAIRGNLLRR
jgi:hypothetical protein